MSDYGSIKSSANTIKSFVETIEDKLLNENETLTENPSGFLPLLLDMVGSLNEMNFYEFLMTSREIHSQTALQKRSLLAGLSEENLPGVFGTPASMTFVIGFPIEELKSKAVSIPGNVGKSKLVLDRDLKMQIGSHPAFVLNHDIEIIVSDEGIDTKSVYAMFDMSDEIDVSMTDINNPFINSQIINDEGVDYFIMFVPMKQFQRLTYEYELTSSDNLYSYHIPYEDNLVGFGVKYKAPGETSWNYLHGYLDGLPTTDGYNYTLRDQDDGSKTLIINFNRSPNTFNPIPGSTLEIMIYTTLGEDGNFSIPNYETSVDGLKIELAQDKSDDYQSPILEIQPTISLIEGDATGGKTEKTLEEIRTMVMNQSKSVLIAPNQISVEAEKIGLTGEKVRDDIVSIMYKLSSTMKVDGNIIPTSMNHIETKLKDIPFLQSVSTRVLSPSDTYVRTGDDYVKPVSEPESLSDYLIKYNNNTDTQFKTPFHLQLKTNDIIQTRCYDLNIDEELETNFLFYNEDTLDKTNVTKVKIFRNATEDIKDENNIYRGKYKISFDLITSTQVADYVKQQMENGDPLVKYLLRVNLSFITQYGDYISEPCTITSVDGDTISFEYELETDNGFDDYNRMSFINQCVQVLPRANYAASTAFMDNFDMRLNILFKELDDSKVRAYTTYDTILSEAEKNDKYYISTVYEIPSVKIFEDITDEINIVVDAKMTQPVYATYDEVVYDTYLNTEYEYDGNGDLVYVSETYVAPGGTSIVRDVPKVLHLAGEVKVDGNGDPIVKYNAGDIKYDANNNPIVETEAETLLIINGVPMYDRIYAGNNYLTVVNSFMNLIEKVNSIDVKLPDGCNSVIGLRNTIGKGDYKFTNQKTGEPEELDNLALSLVIGLKLQDVAGVDEAYITELTKEYIVDYISSEQTKSVSLNKMLKAAESTIPMIDYLELYKVNSYDPGICHTIYKDPAISKTNDFLCIKSVVDEVRSNIQDGILYFIPDITIEIIK